MLSNEAMGAFTLAPPLTVAGWTEVSPGFASAGYGMPATGEPGRSFVRAPAASPRNGKKSGVRATRKPETRAAQRAAWGEARRAAAALIQAIEENDAQSRFIAADDLERALGKLWAVRADRDAVWKMILNHAQGMLRQLFKEKLVEALSATQGKAIREIVEHYLGPATKLREDLTEVVRLIGDAGCDPYFAISGDPQDE